MTTIDPTIETTPQTGTKNLLTELTKTLTLPDGCDAWAIRAVRPDFRSRNNFRWPFPGNTATAPGPINRDNTDGCPSNEGDGICLGHTWKGMASGGVPAVTLLLCAYAAANVLGMTDHEQKFRVTECVVVDVVDGARLVKEQGSSADLSYADLRYADLRSADLSSADLSYANLSSADLRSADLRSADLRSADLRSANLRSANLRSADLRYADLRYADLSYANLSSADLRYADLRSADLRSADLRSADLRSADLRSANLRSADLRSADLRSADLRSANLRSANLRYADLRYADLSYANLSSADLRYADLRSADLRYANLRYEIYANEYTICPTGFIVENGLLVQASVVATAAD